MILKNLISVLIPTLLGSALSLGLNQLEDLRTPNSCYSLIYFALTCFVFNLVYTHQSWSKSFSDLLFAGIIIRLLSALVVILIYALFQRVDFARFAIHFVCHYVLFTIFEIRFLISLIRNTSHKNHEKEVNSQLASGSRSDVGSGKNQ